jgi:hypothetical protein
MKKRFYQIILILPVLVLLGSALAPGVASGQEDSIVANTKKLANSEAGASAGDEFGYWVAIDGSTLAVGVRSDDDGVSNSGSAFLFSYTDVDEFPRTKLTENRDAQSNDYFGNALDISGDAIVIGASQDDDINGTNSGAAYVMRFSYDGGKWTISDEGRLTPSEPSAGGQFGNAVAISGDRVVVANKKEGVYVFEDDGSAWKEKAKLSAVDAQGGENFGSSVAIDGDTIVVGAIYSRKGDLQTGSVYVFKYNGSDWQEETPPLFGDDLGDGDKFGSSVALEGDTIIVGAPYHDGAESNTGAAYVFRRNAGAWIQEAKLIGSDPSQNGRFGNSVALSGNTAVVGASRNDLEVDNNLLVDAGSAYLFRFDGSRWNQTDILISPDAAAGDEFGCSVAISGDLVLVGAYKGDNAELDSGSAYVYTLVPENHPPVADAGENLRVEEGSLVTLDASDSYDLDGDHLSYSWTQPDGQDVKLDMTNEAEPTFTAPAWPGEDLILSFKLMVNDGKADCLDPAVVEVTVLPSSNSVTEINSVLSSAHRPWGIDKDIYTFHGTQGKQVTVTLKAKTGGKNNHGDRATLQLKDNIKGIGFQRTHSGTLPNQISATLPATGEYQVIVAGEPRSFRGKRFLGEYTLTVEGASGSLEKGAGSPVVHKNTECSAKSDKQQSMWNWIWDRFRH